MFTKMPATCAMANGDKALLKSRDERKRVAMRFAHLKTHHGFERMRLRGLSGARDEFHLAAIVTPPQQAIFGGAFFDSIDPFQTSREA
jgi:hypothetical protein